MVPQIIGPTGVGGGSEDGDPAGKEQGVWVLWACPPCLCPVTEDSRLILLDRWLRGLTRSLCLAAELSRPLGSPIFPSGCEGKLGVALESLQGRRDLT